MPCALKKHTKLFMWYVKGKLICPLCISLVFQFITVLDNRNSFHGRELKPLMQYFEKQFFSVENMLSYILLAQKSAIVPPKCACFLLHMKHKNP